MLILISPALLDSGIGDDGPENRLLCPLWTPESDITDLQCAFTGLGMRPKGVQLLEPPCQPGVPCAVPDAGHKGVRS